MLSQINGDYAWNNFIKKQKQANQSPVKNKKKKDLNAGLNIRDLGSNKVHNFNIMDAKQLLEFTKDKLDWLSSSHHSDKL